MPTLVLLIAKLRRHLIDFGLAPTVRKTLARLVATPVYARELYRIYKIDLGRGTDPPTASGAFDLRLLQPGDRKLIAQVERWADWMQGRVATLLSDDALCLVALHGHRLVGFNLVLTGTVFIGAVRLSRTFRPGTAWSEYIWVHRDFRQRGLGMLLRRRLFEVLRARGIRHLYGGALPSNLASLALARRTGFHDVANIEYRRVLFRASHRWRRVGR